jgi:hypothetical protein
MPFLLLASAAILWMFVHMKDLALWFMFKGNI